MKSDQLKKSLQETRLTREWSAKQLRKSFTKGLKIIPTTGSNRAWRLSIGLQNIAGECKGFNCRTSNQIAN